MPTCLPGYILVSEDGTKHEGYTCRLGVLSEPVCRRATFADTADVKKHTVSRVIDDINTEFREAVDDCILDAPFDGICSDSIFGPISDWNTSLVTSMDWAFSEKTRFNGNITGWDTSSVTDMSYMFNKAKAFDQDIGNWKNKTSQVTTMDSMFWGAEAFNRDISEWNVASVVKMGFMFYDAKAFSQSLESWKKQLSRISPIFGVLRLTLSITYIRARQPTN